MDRETAPSIADAFLQRMAASPTSTTTSSTMIAAPHAFWDTPTWRVQHQHGVVDVARDSGRVVRFSGDVKIASLSKVKAGVPRALAVVALAAPDLDMGAFDGRVEAASGWVHFTLRPPAGAVSFYRQRVAVRLRSASVLEGFERTDLAYVRHEPVAVAIDRARTALAALARRDKLAIDDEADIVLAAVHLVGDHWVTTYKARTVGTDGESGTVEVDADTGEACGPDERQARREQLRAR